MKKGLSCGREYVEVSCLLTSIFFHGIDNYQKTLDHPSDILKAC